MTFLNVTTSSYGLVIAFIAGELVKANWRFAYLVFGLPIPAFGLFYFLRPLSEPLYQDRGGSAQLGGGGQLNHAALLAVVTGHMSIHILIYLEMSRIKTDLLGFTADTTTATISYLFGHILGAVSYRRVEFVLANPLRHIVVALGSWLVASLGLFFF